MPPNRPDADLSPGAVARRLADLADLYRLAQSLSQARILGPLTEFPLQARDLAQIPREPEGS
jgi:hypothetical protein